MRVDASVSIRCTVAGRRGNPSPGRINGCVALPVDRSPSCLPLLLPLATSVHSQRIYDAWRERERVRERGRESKRERERVNESERERERESTSQRVRERGESRESVNESERGERESTSQREGE